MGGTNNLNRDPATVCLERMGMTPKPYGPRCDFGRRHVWMRPPDSTEEQDYCLRCGVVSSLHPVSMSPRPDRWEPREETTSRRVDSVTRARMVLEHPGLTGGAAA
jgi:hypothetical protein